jgi:hypothetical protein
MVATRCSWNLSPSNTTSTTKAFGVRRSAFVVRVLVLVLVLVLWFRVLVLWFGVPVLSVEVVVLFEGERELHQWPP